MRKWLFFFFILRGIVAADAQCLEGNCDNGFGKRWFLRGDSVLYEGNFRNKLPHGYGKAWYRHGKQYEGGWADGKWDGYGTLTTKGGLTVVGEWEKSVLKSTQYTSLQPLGNAFAEADADNKPAPDFPEANIVPVNSGTGESVAAANHPDETEPKTDNTVVENDLNTKQVDTFAIETITSSDANLGETERKPINPNATPEIWALAIGVAEYNHPSVQVLKYPDNDAFGMYAFWKSAEGGSLDDSHARVLVDDAATKANVMDALKIMVNKANPNDLMVVFFSGHGFKGSFLTTDYDGGSLRLHHAEINALLANCPAKHKLVIADACHAGSYVDYATKGTKQKDEIPSRDAAELLYKELDKSPAGTAFLLSSTSEEESLEVSDMYNSVFTYFVLKGLKGEANVNNDNIVTLQELFDYVHLNVKTQAQNLGKTQTPVLKGQFDPNMPVAVLRK